MRTCKPFLSKKTIVPENIPCDPQRVFGAIEASSVREETVVLCLMKYVFDYGWPLIGHVSSSAMVIGASISQVGPFA